MGDRKRGLYAKFKNITRTDGASRKGRKHYQCEYFVLDLNHDPHMVPALIAYAESASRDGYNQLASKLLGRVMQSPAYNLWHQLKYNQLTPRQKKFLQDMADTERDMNRA